MRLSVRAATKAVAAAACSGPAAATFGGPASAGELAVSAGMATCRGECGGDQLVVAAGAIALLVLVNDDVG